MKSKVYFIKVSQNDSVKDISIKLKSLLGLSKALSLFKSGDNLAIKLHFGEEGNTGYVKPEYAAVIVDCLKDIGAKSFLSDTNTLYQGKRTNSSDHLKLAYEHGFIEEVVKAPVIIPDDNEKSNIKEISLNEKFIKIANIAKVFYDADGIISLAHFKGHIITGFGGALKNLGMGCAMRQGKLAQHSDFSPFVIKKKCIGCKACQLVCPVAAINIQDNKAMIDNTKCIGCASCIAACKSFAIEVNWEAGAKNIQEKMIEYTKAVLSNKKDKALFLNFCIKITKECDCMAKDDPRIAPDLGILLSTDPVSVDKASFDLIIKASKKDVFKEAHSKRNGAIQLDYASKLGLGSLEYELITLE